MQNINNEEIAKIITECYEEVPSMPGWYRDLNKLCHAVNNRLVPTKIEIDSFKSVLEDMGAIVNPNYIDKETGVKMEAVKIVSPSSSIDLTEDERSEIRKIVTNVIQTGRISVDKEGWYKQEELSHPLRRAGLIKEKYEKKYGKKVKLRSLLEQSFGKSLEVNVNGTISLLRFKITPQHDNQSTQNSCHRINNTSDNSSSHGNTSIPPFKIRHAYRELINDSSLQKGWVKAYDLMKKVNWPNTSKEFTRQYGLQTKLNNTTLCVRISNISKYEILDDMYFDPHKNSYPKNMLALKDIALEEPWEDDKKNYGLLDNYICYTYARIKEEGKISMSEDELHGCWNTGLVDYRYESIYCYMTRKSTSDRWVFQGFCIDGEDLGKIMAAHISTLPARALYFTNGNLLFDPDPKKLTVDTDHIIIDHPSRLPEEWVTRALGKSIKKAENESIAQYDARLGEFISNDRNAVTHLKHLLEQAVNIALLRCQWNYKTAIPYYDPNAVKQGNTDNIGWFLPLCVSKGLRYDPFAALVVTKLPSGRYQGQTIYKLSWAYRCARLVCRPDSDWLAPSTSSDEDIEDLC